MQTITKFTLIAGAGFALRIFPAATFVSKVTDNPEDHYSDRMNIHDQIDQRPQADAHCGYHRLRCLGTNADAVILKIRIALR
jgi:hypothetical protein